MQIYIYQSQAYRLGLPAPYAVTIEPSSSALPSTPGGWYSWSVANLDTRHHPEIAASLNARGFWESR